MLLHFNSSFRNTKRVYCLMQHQDLLLSEPCAGIWTSRHNKSVTLDIDDSCVLSHMMPLLKWQYTDFSSLINFDTSVFRCNVIIVHKVFVYCNVPVIYAMVLMIGCYIASIMWRTRPMIVMNRKKNWHSSLTSQSI